MVVPLGGDVSAADFNRLQAQVDVLHRRVPFAYGRITAAGNVVGGASSSCQGGLECALAA